MKREQGFTLVELSIVILIMGLILGGLAMPLSTQLENGRMRETQDLMSAMEDAIQGYAIVNGHLPCPATPSSNGLSATVGGACVAQHGFVPATTLGLAGPRNADNLMLDAWASPFRYSVSASDVDTDGNWDFVAPGEMRDITMSALTPDLVVCSSAAGAGPTSCSGPATTLTDTAPIVIFSMGKDWGSFTSSDQLENVGASLGGGPSGTSYPIAQNRVSVSRHMSELPGAEFDDLVWWGAAGSLYHRMVAGGQLP